MIYSRPIEILLLLYFPTTLTKIQLICVKFGLVGETLFRLSLKIPLTQSQFLTVMV